jgi:glycosyltransferase involved in cell wall biosynthesis
MFRIVQVNTKDVSGGAAIASYRLHRGLVDSGTKCSLIVRHKESTDNTVACETPAKPDLRTDHDYLILSVLQERYVNLNRSSVSDTQFSLSFPGHDLGRLAAVRSADIINLHWVANYQSPFTIGRLLDLGKPVVWTLHDQWPFTGGCHFSAGCEKYKQDCFPCPQLENDEFKVPWLMQKDKQRNLNRKNLTIVSPSRWMADCAGKSAVLRGSRIEVIPNGIETDIFMPIPKPDAKAKMGFEPNGVVILFGSRNLAGLRKGGQELLEAVRQCRIDPGFREGLRRGNIRLVCFGSNSGFIAESGLPITSLGYLNSREALVAAYAAADVFVLPSREDNLPNTMLEAMSCGTPVVAFDTGGISEAVVDGLTGRLVEPGNVAEMAEVIVSMASQGELRSSMGAASRKTILESFSVEVQVKGYLRLFHTLLREAGHKPLRHESDQRNRNPATANADSRLCHPTGLDPELRDALEPVMVEMLKDLYVEAESTRITDSNSPEPIVTNRQAMKLLLGRAAQMFGLERFLRKHIRLLRTWSPLRLQGSRPTQFR